MNNNNKTTKNNNIGCNYNSYGGTYNIFVSSNEKLINI